MNDGTEIAATEVAEVIADKAAEIVAEKDATAERAAEVNGALVDAVLEGHEERRREEFAAEIRGEIVKLGAMFSAFDERLISCEAKTNSIAEIQTMLAALSPPLVPSTQVILPPPLEAEPPLSGDADGLPVPEVVDENPLPPPPKRKRHLL